MLTGVKQRIARALGLSVAQPASGQRWVAIDVETTGLDPSSDSLLSIGAVAIHGLMIEPSDSFEAWIRPSEAPTRDNILVHGIGLEAQTGGERLETVLGQLASFVEGAPLVAFHASFDQGFIKRAMSRHGLALLGPWLDLAELAPAVLPGRQAYALDDWLNLLGIPVFRRHSAVGDAFATAMLCLALCGRVAPAERDWAGLSKLARQGKWLAPSR
jgi:DNA polymerase-3 subunit epsilon